MHFTPAPFWLMIVSTTTAVLPVPRSPMINWRWPRPLGVLASVAPLPVGGGPRPPPRPRRPPAGLTARFAFLDVGRLPHDHRADGVLIEVEGHAEQAAGELQQLAGHRVGETGDARYAVTDGDDVPDGGGLQG